MTEAALRIFDRQDWLRENRMRARIKVLVDKIGMDAFRELVDEELKGDWVNERDFTIDHLLYVHDEEADAPAVPESYGSAQTATSASSTPGWTPTSSPSARRASSRRRSRSHAAT